MSVQTCNIRSRESGQEHAVRVQSFAISMDGYGAGPRQDLQNPTTSTGTDKLTEMMLAKRVPKSAAKERRREGLLERTWRAVGRVSPTGSISVRVSSAEQRRDVSGRLTHPTRGLRPRPAKSPSARCELLTQKFKAQRDRGFAASCSAEFFAPSSLRGAFGTPCAG